MNDLRNRSVNFASLNESIDTNTPTGMFMFHMIAALAEFERALISERTKAGLAAARRRGSKLGRPRALAAHELAEAERLLQTHPETFVAEYFDIHVKTLRSALYPGTQRSHPVDALSGAPGTQEAPPSAC